MKKEIIVKHNKTRNKHNKTYRVLNYAEYLLISILTVAGCVSIFDFASLVVFL